MTDTLCMEVFHTLEVTEKAMVMFIQLQLVKNALNNNNSVL